MIRAFHILCRVVVLLAAFALMGCVEKDVMPERLVTLQVSLDTDKATKAEASDAQNEIHSVRIYAYRTDTGSQVGHYYRGNASTEPIYMDIALPEKGQYEVEFFVFVNETSVILSSGVAFDEKMTREQLKQIHFNSLHHFEASPLYGIHKEMINVDNVSSDPNTMSGHEGHYILTQKVTLSLYHSLSKLSVYAAMAEGVSKVSVHYVGVLKGGLRQHVYYLPADESALMATPSRAVGRDLMTTEKALTKNASSGSPDTDDYDMLVCDHYISETEVGSDALDVKADDRQVTIHVQYSVGEGGELRNGYIYMPKIRKSTHYNICLLITSEGRIILSYTVAPWDEADMTEIWFDYPTHSFLEDDTEDDRPASPAQMSMDNPFVCYFKMTYPANETWRPTVLGENSGRVTVNVYRDMVKVIPPVAADADNWYRIEVVPDADLEVGKEVELAVTYSPDFSTDDRYEFLLVNGSQNNWYWPYNGASQQDANKVIVTVVE